MNSKKISIGDLSPDNMINSKGIISLIDFEYRTKSQNLMSTPKIYGFFNKKYSDIKRAVDKVRKL